MHYLTSNMGDWWSRRFRNEDDDRVLLVVGRYARWLATRILRRAPASSFEAKTLRRDGLILRVLRERPNSNPRARTSERCDLVGEVHARIVGPSKVETAVCDDEGIANVVKFFGGYRGEA